MTTHQSYQPDCYLEFNSNHLDQSDSPSFRSIRSLNSDPSLSSQTEIYQTHQECLAIFTGHTSYIASVTLSGKLLFTGSSDREIRLWKRNTLEAVVTDNNVITAGEGAVKSLVVSGNKLFSAHQDHKIRVWKINCEDEHDQDCKSFNHIATLPTLSDRIGKLLFPKNQVQVRRHKKSTWVHHVDTVSGLALTRDGTLLYSVSWDRTIKIWRTTDFKCLESVTNAHEDAINAVAVADDGDVYTGSADTKIKIWRKHSQEKKHFVVAVLEKHMSGINALALSCNGAVLYSGACDRTIVVWEKDEEGNMCVKGTLRGHKKSILSFAVVSDILFSASEDKTVRIWRNYSCLAVLEGHKGPIKCITATVENSGSCETSYLIYTGSLDCEIRVWQVLVPL